jgi:predicted peptidase
MALLAPGLPASAANVNDFLVYNFLGNNSNILLPGRLYVPTAYASDPATPRPLILFLHGSGESGTNNTSQVNGNIDNLLAAAKARDAFLYAPQTNAGWGSSSILGNAMSMIDRAISDYRVDTNRIYVTGLSMGGGGAWTFLNQFHDRVAVTVPICAVPPAPDFDFEELLDEPLWAFHGRFDSTVSATYTRNVIDTFLTIADQPLPTYPPLNSFGPNVQFDFPPLDLHYTDWRGGHDIWGPVYNTSELYNWMFTHGAIPEPTSLALAFIALGAFSARRVRPGLREWGRHLNRQDAPENETH